MLGIKPELDATCKQGKSKQVPSLLCYCSAPLSLLTLTSVPAAATGLPFIPRYKPVPLGCGPTSGCPGTAAWCRLDRAWDRHTELGCQQTLGNPRVAEEGGTPGSGGQFRPEGCTSERQALRATVWALRYLRPPVWDTSCPAAYVREGRGSSPCHGPGKQP